VENREQHHVLELAERFPRHGAPGFEVRGGTDKNIQR
jgi:hypothetical protein